MRFDLLLRELDNCESVGNAEACFRSLAEKIRLSKEAANKQLAFSEEDLLEDAEILTQKFVNILERIRREGMGGFDST